MEYAETVLVLGVRELREYDLSVRVFSPSRGPHWGFAFGARRSRRRFVGCLDPLNLVRFQARTPPGKDYIHFTEATLVDSKRALRENPERLGLAVHCLRFLELAWPGPVDAHTALDAAKDLLDRLGDPDAPAALTAPLFRLKLAHLAGFKPDFDHCAVCGKPLCADGEACHLPDLDQTRCGGCRPARTSGRDLGPALCALVNALDRSKPVDWDGACLDSEARTKLLLYADDFVRRKLGVVFESGRFRRL